MTKRSRASAVGKKLATFPPDECGRYLVTGGSRGQGAAEARLFAASGAAVMVCDVLEAEGRTVAASIGTDAARFQRLDVGDPAGWKAAVAAPRSTSPPTPASAGIPIRPTPRASGRSVT